MNETPLKKILFVGRSNTGKSSVINLLTGKKVKTGKKPGSTRDFVRINLGREFEIIDVPGFGFMYGVEAEKQEKMKTKIIKYLEKNKNEILFAVEVLDLKMFPELAQRWKERGYIPLDVEWYYFLEELDLKPIVVANKIDKISPFELEDYLNNLVFELGLSGHWKELSDFIIPFSAKTGKGFKELRKAIHKRLEELGELDFMKFIRKNFY